MMSEWVAATLSDVARLDVQTVDVRHDEMYPIIGVFNRGRGLLYRDSMKGVDTAYKTLNLVRPGQIVYSRLKAFEGAITVAPHSLGSAFASQEFPTFTCSPDLLPEYFALLTTTPALWDTLQNLSTGMGGRRERVKPADFLTIKIDLPLVPEQRRIVAVMAAIDAQVEALEVEIVGVRAVRDLILSSALAELPDRISFGSVATTRSGPSWAAGDESKTPVNGALRVIKITNTKADGTLDMTDETFVGGLPATTPRLTKSSLVIIRTNGNRDRIGNVYRPSEAALGCSVSAFQFISQAIDPADRDYLYWALREPSMQKRMSEAASGSTGLGNLAVKWLNAAVIPWADTEMRAAIVTRFESADSTVRAHISELGALRRVRADLLDALLSHEITTAETVDQFLKGA